MTARRERADQWRRDVQAAKAFYRDWTVAHDDFGVFCSDENCYADATWSLESDRGEGRLVYLCGVHYNEWRFNAAIGNVTWC